MNVIIMSINLSSWCVMEKVLYPQTGVFFHQFQNIRISRMIPSILHFLAFAETTSTHRGGLLAFPDLIDPSSMDSFVPSQLFFLLANGFGSVDPI